MPYPSLSRCRDLVNQLELYAQLKHEHGARGIGQLVKQAERELKTRLAELKKLPADEALAEREPDRLDAIHERRPKGPRKLWDRFDKPTYRDRLEGALLGRFAGCTLGAPVEFWPIDKMEALAEQNEQVFPPVDYWTSVPEPASLRYQVQPRRDYTRDGIDGVPVDDDIVYTLLGLLVAEDYGLSFTIDDVGEAWLRYLPHACTAEEVALGNLDKGVPTSTVAVRDNPYREWIGADIRADPWGYLAPGWPEQAARMAWTDASISHRRQGIYGEMYFAAVIAAAFAVDDPVEALRIGLTEIPRQCKLATAVRWALKQAPDIKDYRQARQAVDEKFRGMNPVHTINNACLTIFGLTLGGRDLTRVIGQTVAMGLDNDCTAATAGSICGAVVGAGGIPEHWSTGFNNTVHSYLKNRKTFTITGLIRRFGSLAKKLYEGT
ncbi:MAG: ADP-ribosylglycohydrolase family protein [Planctomycetota bacterium]